MGFNSTLFIVNDAIAEIDRDPSGWWKKAREALVAAGARGPVEFGHGGFVNHFTAVSNEHADFVTLLAAGGNMAVPLGRYFVGINAPGANFHEVDGQAVLVQKWAAEHNMALINVDTFHDKVSHGLLNADWNEGLLSSEGATQWADKLLEDLTLR